MVRSTRRAIWHGVVGFFPKFQVSLSIGIATRATPMKKLDARLVKSCPVKTSAGIRHGKKPSFRHLRTRQFGSLKTLEKLFQCHDDLHRQVITRETALRGSRIEYRQRIHLNRAGNKDVIDDSIGCDLFESTPRAVRSGRS